MTVPASRSMNLKKKRECSLADTEFTRLGRVHDKVSGNGSQVLAGTDSTICLLMLTGCGKFEIMLLPCKHVDLDMRRSVHCQPNTVGL